MRKASFSPLFFVIKKGGAVSPVDSRSGVWYDIVE